MILKSNMCICDSKAEGQCEFTGFETLSESNAQFVASSESVVIAMVSVSTTSTFLLLVLTRKRLLLYHLVDIC